MFEEKESYKHKLAKDLLFEWLTNIENEKRNADSAFDDCELPPFLWRPNYGIFKELKFYETDDPYYFEQSQCLKISKNKIGEWQLDRSDKNPLQWFRETQHRVRILFVPDITIFRKGIAAILIEIVHKNSVSREKLDRIKNFYGNLDGCVRIFEIDAEEILKQINVPSKLNCIELSFKVSYSEIEQLIEKGDTLWRPERKKNYIEEVFRMIKTFKKVDQELYLMEAAKSIGIKYDSLYRDFKNETNNARKYYS